MTTENASDKRIDELERELRGVQEMLGYVLEAVGEPVEVSKAKLRAGLPDAQISIDDQDDKFVFSLGFEDA